MIRLIASSSDGHSAERVLEPGETLRFGSSPGAGGWKISWEPFLAAEQAVLSIEERGIRVARSEGAANPLFHRGRAADLFVLTPSEHFVVGDTLIRATADRRSSVGTDSTIAETEEISVDLIGYSVEEVRAASYRNADERLEVLSGLHEVIRSASNDAELYERLVLLLLAGVPASGDAAIVRLAQGEGAKGSAVEVLCWRCRGATEARGGFAPSRRLTRDAVENRRVSVRTLADEEDAEATGAMNDDLPWSFCVPIPGAACADWAFYVNGSSTVAVLSDDLRSDLKFAELVAEVLGALRDNQTLEQQQSTLRRFFSPSTVRLLASDDAEKALTPRQVRVTVLFCDLRGFSRESERSRDDLLNLLERVSYALDVMTQCIHAHNGVVADFQGDAALAFWGWPYGSPDDALAACRAALDIRRRFAEAQEDPLDPLHGFRCGAGVASGEVVAGRLGTAGRFKIDVFGPVVNLASRLEGITKQLRVPILADDFTVAELERRESDIRHRRLARVRPAGMEQIVEISEILPDPEDHVEGENVLSDLDIDQYEAALRSFTEGSWEEAYALLHGVPHWDYGKDFLTAQILLGQREAPPGWDGVIRMTKK